MLQLHGQVYLGIQVGNNYSIITDENSTFTYEDKWGFNLSVPLEYEFNDQISLISDLQLLQGGFKNEKSKVIEELVFIGSVNRYYLQPATGIKLSSGNTGFNFYMQFQIYAGFLLGTYLKGYQTWPADNPWFDPVSWEFDTTYYNGFLQKEDKYVTYVSAPVFDFGLRPGTGFNYSFGRSRLNAGCVFNFGLRKLGNEFTGDSSINKFQWNFITGLGYSFMLSGKDETATGQ